MCVSKKKPKPKKAEPQKAEPQKAAPEKAEPQEAELEKPDPPKNTKSQAQPVSSPIIEVPPQMPAQVFSFKDCKNHHRREKSLRWFVESLNTGVDGERKATSMDKEKNRNPDYPCLEDKRVVLKFPGVTSDYIHANYYGTSLTPERLICTQTPLENTVYDFWAMIIQENVTNVLMLGSFDEPSAKGEKKSVRYFPENEGMESTFGTAPNVISCPHEFVKGVKTRQLEVSWGDHEKRDLLHWQCEIWPDHGVLKDWNAVFRIIPASFSYNNPVVVHSAKGQGRAGTYALMVAMFEAWGWKLDVDVIQFFKKLRRIRPYAVENELQYLFVHRFLFIQILRICRNFVLPDAGAERLKEWIARYDCVMKTAKYVKKEKVYSEISQI
ncbi:unnamed protein product [Caenorhabditis auriculariae]|uniref:Tyrosine-protein phosphatase domain-containing protein n=1 Tax=Caenorhabditis auriculariae TaxID=2777116 RepID=A0A8S1H5U2_9PELO|nr:unnamed protein product [Caenorhabditis auriculariae]